MVKRYFSGDYKNSDFTAVCDNLDLPFWNIYETYGTNASRPFVFYVDKQGKCNVAIGEISGTHNDVIADKLKLKVNRINTLCGRIWTFNSVKILTIWDETPKNLMTAQMFTEMAILLHENNCTIYDAMFIFEVNADRTIKKWSFQKPTQEYYIYTIPVKEYISNKLSSFSDVVNLYEIQQRKRSIPSAAHSNRYDEYGGYLPYKLLRYQSDESKSNKDKDMINESILSDNLPDDIKSALLNNTTSLGNNPAIPDIFDVPFLLKIANSRFEEIKNTLIEIREIDDFEDTEISSMLSKLIEKCKELERPYRNELEKLCVNYVIDTFAIPEDSVEINVSLTDKIDLNAPSIIVDPIDGDEDFQFDDVNSASSIRGEVFKRRILDALCMGESLMLSSNIGSYAESVSKISTDLCELYKKIIALNNYILFMSDDIGISDKHKSQLGTVNVEFGNEDEQVRITSQGMIFPVLLSETIRGFMELFVSHGLPKDKKIASIVIGKSDFLKAEPWDMRLGPSLWAIVSKSFNDITLNELPYLLKRIASLDVDKFNFFMKEVFAKTKKGRQLMSILCAKSKNDIEYNKFTDKMSKMKMDKSMITDEFINEDEL